MNNELIYLTENISKQSIWIIAWVGLATFSQICSKTQEPKKQSRENWKIQLGEKAALGYKGVTNQLSNQLTLIWMRGNHVLIDKMIRKRFKVTSDIFKLTY
jgi:hypothetical protein